MVAPGLLMVVALLIMGGRIAIAGGAVEHAAAEGSRAASIARTAQEAAADGVAAARRSLDRQDIQCVNMAPPRVDTAQFSRPPGQPATVSVTVTCEVRLSDIAIPGLPGSRTITETVESPLDTYRMRQ